MNVLLSTLPVNSVFRLQSSHSPYWRGIFRYIGKDSGKWLVCDTLATFEKDGTMKVNHPAYYETKYFYGTEMVEAGTLTTNHQFISEEEMNQPKTTARNVSDVFNAPYPDAGLTKIEPVDECHSDFKLPYAGPMNGDHLEYKIENKDVAPEDRSDWPLPSFDALDWAKCFMKHWGNNRDEIDESLMVSWFANALMRGYDQGVIFTLQSTDHEERTIKLTKEALQDSQQEINSQMQDPFNTDEIFRKASFMIKKGEEFGEKLLAKAENNKIVSD